MNSITKAAGALCTIVAVAMFSIESSAADSAKEMAALQAVDQEWARAYNAGNADAVASLYGEQAVLLPPGAPAVNGRAAIKAFFVKDTAESQKAGVVFSLGPKPAGGVSGDMGWQSGTYAVMALSRRPELRHQIVPMMRSFADTTLPSAPKSTSNLVIPKGAPTTL